MIADLARRRGARVAAYVAVAGVDALLASSTSRRAHQLRVLTKPALMPLLASSTALAPSPLQVTTLGAQAAGWLGDVALLSESPRALVAGSSAFAAGHASYVAGFARHRSEAPLLASRRARLLAGVWAAAAPVNAWKASRSSRAEGISVAAYSGALTSMSIASGHLGPSLSPASRRLAAAGGLMFLTSDSLLGLRKFVLGDRLSPVASGRLEGAVMATYTGAQLLLAEALARA